jgi:D-alanine-D-alanine ligase
VLIEEYIEGREIYVAVLGNQDPEALPIVELDLSQLPEGTPRIAGTEVKWEEGTEVYRCTQPFFPDDLDPEVEEKLKQTAIAAYSALRLRDYGRIDIRLDAEGNAHVIECNPNPWLLSTAEFAKAAKKSGRSHCDLIAEIVQLAIARYGA